MAASANEVRGKAVMRQLELLRKQRDEAFSSRALAVDELRQRIVHEGHALAAMRAGFGEGAEQLRSALAQLPLTDESMSTSCASASSSGDGRRCQAAPRAREGHARWRRGFVRHWNGWRELIARSKLTRASHKAKKTVLATEQKGKQMAAEVEAEVQRRQEEATKARRSSPTLRCGFETRRRARARALLLKEMEALRRRPRRRRDGAPAARQLRTLWYEQREALEEAEALRHEISSAATERARRWRPSAS